MMIDIEKIAEKVGFTFRDGLIDLNDDSDFSATEKLQEYTNEVIEMCAKHLEKNADEKYADCMSSEPDTGATVFNNPDVESMYIDLMEAIDDLRNLKVKESKETKP